MQEARTVIDAVKSDLTFMREGFIISEIKGVYNTLQISFYDITDTRTIPFIVEFIGMFKILDVPVTVTKDARALLTYFNQKDILEGL